jgi:hypothetical protein
MSLYNCFFPFINYTITQLCDVTQYTMGMNTTICRFNNLIVEILIIYLYIGILVLNGLIIPNCSSVRQHADTIQTNYVRRNNETYFVKLLLSFLAKTIYL